MKMTFNQYISNPMGIKNSVYSHSEVYRKLYSEKLDTILVREVGNVKYKLYNGSDDTYYILMNIPSEVIENFYYDVVIMFYTDKESAKLKRDLKDYYVKFYSNDPSFVFTFAHAMLKNDMFIKDLVPRMSKEAVKKVAVERNPDKQIGYVKSVYFTYLLMNNYNLFQKIKFESEGEKYDKKKLLSIITHADDKIADRQEKGEELNKKKRVSRKSDKEKKINSDNFNRTLTNPVSKSDNGLKTSTTKKVSNSNTVKKTSKIKKK